MDLFRRWQRNLDELHSLGRYRTLRVPEGIDFSSNDYLGYGNEIVAESVSLPRSGMASRLLRGHHPIWDDVESALADWHRAEAVLMFPSGYSANEGLLSTIIEPGDFLASDQLNHASLIDGARLSGAERFIYRHNDLDHLASGLRLARRTAGRELFVLTEALFSMDGDRTPLAEIADVCERHGAHLIVDEAHTTGCFGPSGSGRVAELGLRRRVLASVHTGGKALGVAGAYVCGSELLKKILVNRCRQLIFTTALPPVIASWWLDMLQRVRADDSRRQALHAAARLFRTELRRGGCVPLGADYIVPVVIGDDAGAVQRAKQLQVQGYDIRAIRPPTVPSGTARLRISIHADHGEAVLKSAAAAVSALTADR